MDKELKNSIEYISKKVGTKTGFTTPSNYLNNLEDAILVKLSEEKLSKVAGFETPKNYFNNLEDTILAKVSSPKKETKIVTLKSRVLKIIPFAAAASVLLFIGLNSFVFNSTDEFTINNLSENDLEYWISSNIINTNDVTEILQDEILDESDFSLITIKDEVIEDYIYTTDDIDLLNEIE